MDFKDADIGLYFIVHNGFVYRSNCPEYGRTVKTDYIQDDDIQNKSIVFPHSYLFPTHYTNISYFKESHTYTMQLYYNNTILLAPFKHKDQTPLHLDLKREKVESTVFSSPAPNIDPKLCPCKQIYDNPRKIKYEPLGLKNLSRNLQINLQTIGLYNRYKLKLLFLSKLKGLTYDIETSYISFRKDFFY